MKNIELPILHLNGSGRVSLSEDYSAAYASVSSALDALQRTTPNARDYYVSHDPQAFNKALAQHKDRCKALFLVAADLLALCEHTLQ